MSKERTEPSQGTEAAEAGQGRARLPEPLLNSTGFLLNKAAQRVRERFEARLAPLGLRSRHAGVLMTLGEQGPLSQQVLGALHRIDRTTMVAVTDDLERLGLVERQRDPNDRRAYRVQLTRKGTALRARVLQLLEANEAETLASLSAPDRQRLRQLLQQLTQLEGDSREEPT